jgi:putative Ca2+/H+ antiporter (TMEM165/GDT1 family)
VPTFFLAWIAVAICSLGSREQLLLARLAELRGGALALLAIALPAAALSAALMAWAGATVSALLPDAAKTMLVAFALLAAAVELAWPVREKALREPTRSLFALLVVLVARQIGDAGRFLVFAFAAASGTPELAALGGALGGAASALLAVTAADDLPRWPLRPVRVLLAAVVGAVGIYIALSARGLI